MGTCVKKKTVKAVVLAVLPLFFLTLLSFTNAFGDQKIYQDGPFRVRHMGETCKLEIFLESKNLDQSKSKFWKYGFNNETVGFVGVLKTDDYFGELITEKARIGQAEKGMALKFDTVAEKSVVGNDSVGSDNSWKWRHFSYNKVLLERIKKSKTMEVAFSNGKEMFHFNIPLKGSVKALKHLTECRKEGAAPAKTAKKGKSKGKGKGKAAKKSAKK